MRVGWVTDIHLEFVEERVRIRFHETLRLARLDALLIGGDTGISHSLAGFLAELEESLDLPIYFVLGNHDFYQSSITSVRKEVARLSATSRHLRWLSQAGVVKLSETTALVGHDSWADGRCGDFLSSQVLLNDYLLIEELSVKDELQRTGFYRKERLLRKLNALGDQAAEYIRPVLAEALRTFPHVVVLTHVPPFRESCWHEGRISSDDYLPHFTCRAFGQALRETLDQHPDRHLTVLCGHTHGAGFARIADNLEVWTGGAEYGKPVLQRVFQV